MVPKRRAYVRIFFFFNCFASFRGRRTSLFEISFFRFASEYAVKGRTNTNTNRAMTISPRSVKPNQCQYFVSQTPEVHRLCSKNAKQPPQKQWLLTPVRKGQVKQWIKLGNDWKISPEQVRGMLFCKKELKALLQATISPGANALKESFRFEDEDEALCFRH